MKVLKDISTITEPAVEPVSASDYRDFVRMTSTEDDNLISKIITSTRRLCERYMGRPIVNTTFRQSQSFYDNNNSGGSLSYMTKSGEYYIDLQMKPVVSVSSLKLFDFNDNEIVVSSDNYRLSFGKIYFAINYALPTLRNDNAVIVEYVAGLGATANAIPQDIKDAVIMYSKAFYEVNRTSQEGLVSMPTAVKEILNHYKNYNIAL